MSKIKIEFCEDELVALVVEEVRRKYKLAATYDISATCVVDRTESPEGMRMTMVGAVVEFDDELGVDIE